MRHHTPTRTTTRLGRICFLALAAALPLLVGCEEEGGTSAAKRAAIVRQVRLGQFNMGEGVYRVLGKHSGRCAGFVFARNRGLVINAVNVLMGDIDRRQIPQAIEKLYPLIDNQTLPGMVGDVKSVLNIVHGNTPVLQAIVDVSRGPSPVSASLSLQMVGQILSYPEIDRLLHALARLVKADDGRLIDGLLSLASSSLDKLGDELQKPETEEAKKARRSLARELLRELDGVAAGPDVTIPRLDDDGAPLGAAVEKTDPYTEYADKSKQELKPGEEPAEVEWNTGGTEDQPKPNTDYTGETGGFLGGLLDPIEWPAELVLAADKFTADGLNKIGKILNGGERTYAEEVMGRPITRRDPAERKYTLRPQIQMNRTVLAVLMRSLGEAVKAGLHCELSTFLTHALGERVGNGFSPTNPLAQMDYGTLEIFKYAQAPKLLDALAMTLQTDPELGEALLAKVLRLVALVKGKKDGKGDNGKHKGHDNGPHHGFGKDKSGGEGESDELLRKNLVMLDKLFKAPAKGQTSAGRAVIDVITQLGETAKLLPKQFVYMFVYRKLVRGDNGDGNLIDEARSVKVDRTKPAWYTDSAGRLVDNRSSFHRLVNLVKATNACKIPLLNKSLAYLHHEMLAELTPASAMLVNDLLVKVGQGGGAFGDILCKGLKDHVVALQELTTSGTMDSLIPVMKAFKDKGQLQLFIDLLIVMSPTYEDDVRPGEENIVEMLKSGALEVVFDLLSLSNTIRIPGTKNEVVADVLVDFLADLFDHDKPATDIFGKERPAKVYLLIDPMKALSKQLEGTPGKEAYENLIDKAIDVFLDVRHNDAGTPDDPNDDFDTVGNKFLVPLVSRFLSVKASDLERDPVKRVAALEEDQRKVGETYRDPAFVDLVGFLETYCTNENRQLFDDALVYFLTPQDNPQQNLFGSILMLAGMMLQTKADNRAMGTLMKFAGRLIHPSNGYVKRMVNGIFAVIELDDGKVLIGLLRRGFAPHAALGGQSPFGVMLLLSGQIKDRCTGVEPPLTVELLRAKIREFMSALAQADAIIWLIATRRGAQGGHGLPRPDKRQMFLRGTKQRAVLDWQSGNGRPEHKARAAQPY